MASTYGSLRRIHGGVRFSVFRARREDGRDVVIKQALPERPELQASERLAHEHAVLRSLELPGTPRPLELTTLDGRPALVLEDAGAHDLAEILGEHPLPVDAFLELAVQMARIVRDLHARSMIHRDISPENFVLDDASSAVTLVDLESATAVPAFAEAPGLPGVIEGSLAYMAPESTGRMKRLVDRRSDLYALGATFYAMLTGKPPFHARDPLELVHAHAARAPYPPVVVDASVPTLVSNIVIKLLAKMPEQRYQTADALVVDLEDARHQWHTRGEIAGFELGRRDLPYGIVLVPGKLYGRERETAIVADAVERVRGGASEVLLVTGVAGIGKSSLVTHVRELTEGDVRWIAGKGDQLRGNVPYAPILEAFRELVQATLREPAAATNALRERLRAATTPNGRVLVDAIPDLQALLGDPPPVPTVGAREEENRLQLAFAAFVRALLADGSALVLFLDDLQWVDVASLELVRSLAADPDVRSLLVLCAYRSDEAGPGHPVTRTIEGLRAAGARVACVEPGPLDRQAMLALVCDCLRVDRGEAERLAEVVRRKTGANPFFVRQLLGFLYRERLLAFDVERGRWTWDLAGIEASGAMPSAVDDLVERAFGGLPDHARQVLRAAACIGNRFELGLLAGVCDEPMDAVAQALWVPFEQGLVVSVAEGHRFDWSTGTPIELGHGVSPAFRFAHDRIQQAIFASLDDDARRALHLRIGRWLERHVPPESFDGAVGSIADQLDRAVDALDEGERIHLAGLNERAGRHAQATSAHASALGYFQVGLSLLPAEPWRGELHELWFTLLRGAADCAGSTGAHELGEQLVDRGLSHTDVVLERVDLLAVSVRANAQRGEHRQAIARGRAGLAALGIELPDPITVEVASAERQRVRPVLDGCTDAQILDAPAMGDPVDRARLRLLVDLCSSAYLVDPSQLFQVLVYRAVELVATRGSAPGAGSAYAVHAVVLATGGEYREAHRYGRLACRLAERSSDPAEEGRVLLAVGTYVDAWRAPLADSVPLLQRAHVRALESGDLEYAGFALADVVHARLCMGAELDRVRVEARSALAFCRKLHHPSVAGIAATLDAVECLAGVTRSGLDDQQFEQSRRLVDAAGFGIPHAHLHVRRLQTCYLLGEPELALEYATRSKRWLPYLGTHFSRVEFEFYAALTLARLALRARPVERAEALARLREHLEPLATWASHAAPMNVAHKRDLVAAELARIEGRAAEALALYHAAIEQAGREGFVQDEALAHELCGRFHRACGTERMAGLHLGAALEGYGQWGAMAKVESLERELPRSRVGGELRYATQPPALDLLSLVEATETLTEELVLDRLLEKLVRTCAQAAGAQRVVLVLDEGGPFIRASMTASSGVLLETRPLASSLALPVALVLDVLHSREVLVLSDAAREGRYTADPYIARHGVRSVLVVPIVRAERVLGVLYFENGLASDAFPPARVEMFRLLSATIAIAIENSRLFEARTRSEAARERSLSLLQATIEATADGILVVDEDREVAVHNQRFLDMWQIPAVLETGYDEQRLLDLVVEQVENADELVRGVAERHARPELEGLDLVHFHDGRVFERYSRPQRIGDAIVGRVWSFRDVSERERLLRRALFLADATRLLASLDVEPALDSVAQLAVPLLGEGCAIDLFGNGGPRRLVAVSRAKPGSSAPDVHPSVLGGQSVLYGVAGVSCLGVPVLVKGHLVGAISLRATPGRKYTTTELELAEELARRAALAIDNARLYRHAQEALQARDELLAIAAHEIRGPLTSIHLAVQSIRTEKVPSKSVPRLLELVEKEDRRLAHLVDELLDLGRIRAGALRLEYEDVDLADVVRQAVARFALQLASSGSELSVATAGDVVGCWDKTRLDQVVGNLLSNAIKFGRGRPIAITAAGHGSQVRLVVEDHGIGIEPEARARIFEPFERGVSIRHYGGLGLGLYIVKSIVTALGGSVAVDGEPGVGSTFTVELPRSRVGED